MNEMSLSKTDADLIIAEIMKTDGIFACAVVSLEGQILGKSDSSKAPSSFLGISGASMYASAEAACSTFHISNPYSIILDTKDHDGNVIVLCTDKKNLIVAVVKETNKTKDVLESIEKICKDKIEVI